ncbi:MAG: hypothetical protein US31_C0007G0021 [Berkelbacteria bacterium GW2011_GWA1_36_9]|uniref:Uncharacterized protein n=1 Tax=Berkelbacteria bacterium GW2011_GWA1_36_9 TaxID=1618331 RepID=A0A0G0FWK7_9BACT|nr:MAG: hypothetical protein US31_C0007G0021 [Berkelbacteria bacterium GW2011_GWA1_36_9]
MSEQEKIEKVKKLKKGDKVKAKIGDYVVGFDNYEMEFEALDNYSNCVKLKHKISQSRYNPKGRVDNYFIPIGKLIFD